MPTTSPSSVTSGPPELPGFAAASNWIRLVSSRLPSGERNSRLQAGDDARRDRRADAEREADGDDLVAQREVLRGAHRGGARDRRGPSSPGARRDRVPAACRRRSLRTPGRRRTSPDPLRPGDDVEVGEDDALVDDDDPGADPVFDVHVPFLGVAQPEHAHDRGPDRLVRLCRPEGSGFVSSVCSTAASMSSWVRRNGAGLREG